MASEFFKNLVKKQKTVQLFKNNAVHRTLFKEVLELSKIFKQ